MSAVMPDSVNRHGVRTVRLRNDVECDDRLAAIMVIQYILSLANTRLLINPMANPTLAGALDNPRLLSGDGAMEYFAQTMMGLIPPSPEVTLRAGISMPEKGKPFDAAHLEGVVCVVGAEGESTPPDVCLETGPIIQTYMEFHLGNPEQNKATMLYWYTGGFNLTLTLAFIRDNIDNFGLRERYAQALAQDYPQSTADQQREIIAKLELMRFLASFKQTLLVQLRDVFGDDPKVAENADINREKNADVLDRVHDLEELQDIFFINAGVKKTEERRLFTHGARETTAKLIVKWCEQLRKAYESNPVLYGTRMQANFEFLVAEQSGDDLKKKQRELKAYLRFGEVTLKDESVEQFLVTKLAVDGTKTISPRKLFALLGLPCAESDFIKHLFLAKVIHSLFMVETETHKYPAAEARFKCPNFDEASKSYVDALDRLRKTSGQAGEQFLASDPLVAIAFIMAEGKDPLLQQGGGLCPQVVVLDSARMINSKGKVDPYLPLKTLPGGNALSNANAVPNICRLPSLVANEREPILRVFVELMRDLMSTALRSAADMVDRQSIALADAGTAHSSPVMWAAGIFKSAPRQQPAPSAAVTAAQAAIGPSEERPREQKGLSINC